MKNEQTDTQRHKQTTHNKQRSNKPTSLKMQARGKPTFFFFNKMTKFVMPLGLQDLCAMRYARHSGETVIHFYTCVSGSLGRPTLWISRGCDSLYR